MYGYIYLIKNTVNSKLYVGQTTHLPENRWKYHLNELKRQHHINSHLQNSFNKYGEKNFKFSVIQYAWTKEELNKLEIYFINRYNCLNSEKGYNLQSRGSNGKLHELTKQKMSNAHKGKILTKEHRNR